MVSVRNHPLVYQAIRVASDHSAPRRSGVVLREQQRQMGFEAVGMAVGGGLDAVEIVNGFARGCVRGRSGLQLKLAM